jgi:hypothetical protein
MLLWYSSAAQGSEKLQTARYTFTVQDSLRPELTATTSIFFKRPEFTLTVKPNPAIYEEYVELVGNAEKGTGSVRIEVVDNTGKISHTFIAPVGADGYFDYAFHVDMQPGQYQVMVSNPSMKTSLNRTLIILPSVRSAETEMISIVTTSPEVTLSSLPTTSQGSGPTQSPMPPVLAVVAVVSWGFAVIMMKDRRK